MSDGATGVYLRTYLAPFQPMLDRADVTDIFVNRPGEFWTELVGGALQRHAAPELDETSLWRLARQIALAAHQGISREHPLLSATLPGGARVQIAAPPATRGHLAMAIRKHVVADLTLEDYDRSGAFDAVRRRDGPSRGIFDEALRAMLDRGEISAFLRAAIRGRRNFVVSGGTSSGKTTFLNALLKDIPAEERLILIEDAPELQLDHRNAVGLVAVRGEMGETRITTDDLLQASLRMRPDRIILGELRGKEAFSFLRAVNTGHAGSTTSVHADSARGAVEQLALMTLQAGVNLRRAEVVSYVQNVIDVFVHLDRRDGMRQVSEIAFQPRRLAAGAR